MNSPPIFSLTSDYDVSDGSISPPCDTDSFVRRHLEIVNSTFHQLISSDEIDTEQFQLEHKEKHGCSYDFAARVANPAFQSWLDRVRPRLLAGYVKKDFGGDRSAAKRAFFGTETPVNDELTQSEETEAAVVAKAIAEAEEKRKLDFWVPLTGDGFDMMPPFDIDSQRFLFKLLSEMLPTMLDSLPDPLPEELQVIVDRRKNATTLKSTAHTHCTGIEEN